MSDDDIHADLLLIFSTFKGTDWQDSICSRVVPMDRPKYKDMHRYIFRLFNIDFEFLKEVQNSISLHAQIYLITIGLGGRTANEKC